MPSLQGATDFPLWVVFIEVGIILQEVVSRLFPNGHFRTILLQINFVAHLLPRVYTVHSSSEAVTLSNFGRQTDQTTNKKSRKLLRLSVALTYFGTCSLV
jgi:hypothetical protein